MPGAFGVVRRDGRAPTWTGGCPDPGNLAPEIYRGIEAGNSFFFCVGSENATAGLGFSKQQRKLYVCQRYAYVCDNPGASANLTCAQPYAPPPGGSALACRASGSSWGFSYAGLVNGGLR